MTKALHFKICATWLTSHIRNLWAEGSYQKAFNTINAAFPTMSEEMKFSIISGKKKLVKDKDDEQVMNVVDDDWKPDLQRCVYGLWWNGKEAIKSGVYPEPVDVQMNAIYTSKDWFEYQKNKYPQLNTPPARLAEVLEENEEYNYEVVPKGSKLPKPLLMKQFGGYNSLEEMNQAYLLKQSIPTPEQYLQTQKDRRIRELSGKPKPDTTLKAEMGWITPDGKFYACLTQMEHIWLADQFGLSEKQAEEKGWVKISRDYMHRKHIFPGEKDPTQKQINTVFDWCQKHKFELPEWAGGE